MSKWTQRAVHELGTRIEGKLVPVAKGTVAISRVEGTILHMATDYGTIPCEHGEVEVLTTWPTPMVFILRTRIKGKRTEYQFNVSDLFPQVCKAAGWKPAKVK